MSVINLNCEMICLAVCQFLMDGRGRIAASLEETQGNKIKLRELGEGRTRDLFNEFCCWMTHNTVSFKGLYSMEYMQQSHMLSRHISSCIMSPHVATHINRPGQILLF